MWPYYAFILFLVSLISGALFEARHKVDKGKGRGWINVDTDREDVKRACNEAPDVWGVRTPGSL